MSVASAEKRLGVKARYGIRGASEEEEVKDRHFGLRDRLLSHIESL